MFFFLGIFIYTEEYGYFPITSRNGAETTEFEFHLFLEQYTYISCVILLLFFVDFSMSGSVKRAYCVFISADFSSLAKVKWLWQI